LDSPPPHTQATATSSPAAPPAPETAASSSEVIAPTPTSKLTTAERQRIQDAVQRLIPGLERQLPAWSEKFWNLLKKSIGGFLGVTGFLLSLVLVPIHLFFFLKERPRIEQKWNDYLPLRASPLKDEVA